MRRIARKYRTEPTWMDRVFASPLVLAIAWALLLSPLVLWIAGLLLP